MHFFFFLFSLLSKHFSLLFTQIFCVQNIFLSVSIFLRVRTIETTNNRKKILFSDWLGKKKNNRMVALLVERKLPVFNCTRETSNKANCFHCLILLIYAIAWAVLLERRPKLPEWNTDLRPTSTWWGARSEQAIHCYVNKRRFCSLGSRNHFYSQANKICSTRSVILRNFSFT